MAREILQAEIVDPNEIRVDRLVENGARSFVGALEKQTGVKLWDRGLGSVVQHFIANTREIPKRPVTPVSLAKYLGLLK